MHAIDPLNVTAQLAHRARGNPPSTLPASAISNCFPGLEFDFRNIWKLLFEEIELREGGSPGGGHIVLNVAGGSVPALDGVAPDDQLIQVDGRSLQLPITLPSGFVHQLRAPQEFSNGLAHIVRKGGQTVPALFEKPNGAQVPTQLTVRPLFDGVALKDDLAEPGAMTQSLCSPWQADYRECGCYYWAASRPDFVNVENDNGDARGHDWMQNSRNPGDPYRPDAGGHTSPEHISYDDLYEAWEQHLKFIDEDGNDET